MRFFHRGWADGELPDDESERLTAAYHERLEAISERLPEDFLALSKMDLNDALIEGITWIPHAQTLVLELVAGSNQSGYQILTLRFGGAMIGEHRRETMRDLGRDRRVELLYDEIDIDDGELADPRVEPHGASPVLTYRMLFWPTYELTIDFTAFTLQCRTISDRRVSPGDAFRELDQDDLGADE